MSAIEHGIELVARDAKQPEERAEPEIPSRVDLEDLWLARGEAGVRRQFVDPGRMPAIQAALAAADPDRIRAVRHKEGDHVVGLGGGHGGLDKVRTGAEILAAIQGAHPQALFRVERQRDGVGDARAARDEG